MFFYKGVEMCQLETRIKMFEGIGLMIRDLGKCREGILG